MDEKEYSTPPESILEALTRLLEDEKFSDVKFLVGENEEEIFASRNILAVRSPVLDALVYGRSKVDDVDDPSEAEAPFLIPDVSPIAFGLMLRYLYTDLTDTIDETNVMEVLFCADKYQIKPLTKICAAFVREKLTTESVSEFLAFSHVPDDLEQECLEFFKKNADACLKSSSFIHLPKEYLVMLVESDELCVQQEIQVFRACHRWANEQEVPPERKAHSEDKVAEEPEADNPEEQESGEEEPESQVLQEEDDNDNIPKNLLNDVVPLIRFPLMGLHEILGEVQGSGLLSAEQLLQIITFVSFSQDTQSYFPTKSRVQPQKTQPRRQQKPVQPKQEHAKPTGNKKAQEMAPRKLSDDVPQLERFSMLTGNTPADEQLSEMTSKPKRKAKKSLSSEAQKDLFGEVADSSLFGGRGGYDDEDGLFGRT